MEGSIVNQIEISGFNTKKESLKVKGRLKSFKSNFDLSKFDKSINFLASDASIKIKEDYSLVYLFLTEDNCPTEELRILSEKVIHIKIRHLIISPSGEGIIKFYEWENGINLENKEFHGKAAHMLGDLLKGGFN